MKYYNVTLVIKEQGTKNKIRIKSKALTKKAIDNLIMSNLFELLDDSRKDMMELLEELEAQSDIPR